MKQWFKKKIAEYKDASIKDLKDEIEKLKFENAVLRCKNAKTSVNNSDVLLMSSLDIKKDNGGLRSSILKVASNPAINPALYDALKITLQEVVAKNPIFITNMLYSFFGLLGCDEEEVQKLELSHQRRFKG